MSLLTSSGKAGSLIWSFCADAEQSAFSGPEIEETAFGFCGAMKPSSCSVIIIWLLVGEDRARQTHCGFMSGIR